MALASAQCPPCPLDKDLLELYCGCGSHTVALAPFFRQVWGLGGWCPPWWPCAAAKVLSVEINRHLVEAAQHHGSDQRCWGENLVEVAINTLYIVYMSVSNKGFVFGYCFLKNKATWTTRACAVSHNYGGCVRSWSHPDSTEAQRGIERFEQRHRLASTFGGLSEWNTMAIPKWMPDSWNIQF